MEKLCGYPLSDDIPALIISSTSKRLLAIIVLKHKNTIIVKIFVYLNKGNIY